MPIHFPFVSRRKKSASSSSNGRRNTSYRDQDREVLGDIGDSCWQPSATQTSSRRRRSHLTSSMRTVPADRSSRATSLRAGFDSNGLKTFTLSRKICVSDAELVQRARNSSRASRRGRLLRVPSVMWECKEISGFAMLSRRTGAGGENFEVLTTGEVACESDDVEPILCPRTESYYNTVAREFLGDQFIYGSIVHEVQPRGFGDDSDIESDEEEEEKEEDGASGDFCLHCDDHVAVRTACFSRSRRFARNEEWCFLEHFRSRSVALEKPFEPNGWSASSTSSINIDDPTGFTIVLSSMSPSELNAGKMACERVTQLHGITATYMVKPLPQTEGCLGPRVRVSFHATFTAPTNTPEGYADSQTVRMRLTAMARSLHRLPDLVAQRQRRTSQFSPRVEPSRLSNPEYHTALETKNSRAAKSACTVRALLAGRNRASRHSAATRLPWLCVVVVKKTSEAANTLTSS
ncbi:hypothetical protein ON010_g8951 [Phytophthora cinnamomi]|nr:hypothetical protein ON010_g8951 [Phytophthora cinnamomi]